MRTVVHYRNAGRSKIYDDAMAWILLGFLMYPIDALREQWFWLRHCGVAPRVSFGAWKMVWKHQMNVWRGL